LHADFERYNQHKEVIKPSIPKTQKKHVPDIKYTLWTAERPEKLQSNVG
jgi:hypothetical protein